MVPAKRFNCYYGEESCVCQHCVRYDNIYNKDNFPNATRDCVACEGCHKLGHGLPTTSFGECGKLVAAKEANESINLQMTVKSNIEHVIANITKVTRPEIVRLMGYESQKTLLEGLCAELEFLSGLPKDVTRAEVIAGFQQEDLKAKIDKASEAYQSIFTKNL
jgi:hypothetical protein